MNFKNILRVGKISSINYPAGRVRVCFEDQDNMVTDEIPYFSFEYEMPDIGDQVLCCFLGLGIVKGFCFGGFFYSQNMPGQYGKDIYFKKFKKDAWMKYDRATKTITFKADKFIFDGDLTITGDLQVDGSISVDVDISAQGNITTDGNINAKGSIVDVAGNTNHHSHS